MFVTTRIVRQAVDDLESQLAIEPGRLEARRIRSHDQLWVARLLRVPLVWLTCAAQPRRLMFTESIPPAPSAAPPVRRIVRFNAPWT